MQTTRQLVQEQRRVNYLPSGFRERKYRVLARENAPKNFNGEFDPGSELTLAECITHASRAGLPEITSTGSLAADE